MNWLKPLLKLQFFRSAKWRHRTNGYKQQKLQNQAVRWIKRRGGKRDSQTRVQENGCPQNSSVCVPLEGPETDLITQFVQYFSKKAKKGNSNKRLFLEMCICVESGEDTRFREGRTTLEKAINQKMFKCLKLSEFGLEDNCHGMFV